MLACAVFLAAALPVHSRQPAGRQSSGAAVRQSPAAAAHSAAQLTAGAAHLPSRQLLVEEFKGAPSAEEKQADAEKLLAQRPDNLLRNLKVKAQSRTNMFPEGCEVSETGVKQRWASHP